MKQKGPLLGYNNNVPYRGHTYHVQTEDSGVRRPHIITHLFADGGRVVKSTKTSYADSVGDADLVATVRALMKEQHKAMVAALRDGQLDALLTLQAPAAKAAPQEEATEKDEEAVAAAVSPFDLLERAAADADKDFYSEVHEPGEPPPDVSRPSSPPADDDSPGSYRFVGQTTRKTGPRRGSYTPAVGGVFPGADGAPQTRRRGSADLPRPERSTRPQRRPELDQRGPEPEDETDVHTQVYHRLPEQRVTQPESALARSKVVGALGFGGRHISDRSFDQVVIDFLEEHAAPAD